MRVLLIEDERQLAAGVAGHLRSAGMAVDHAPDGPSGLERLAVHDYDVLLLDRQLPGMHGDEVCRRLVADGSLTRILMLTASGDLTDRVAGLELGADDYLAKPFALTELVARVRALARRAHRPAPPVLERDGIRLDPARREASRDGRPLGLRDKEFLVLEELLRAEGAIVSAERLLEKAWDENIDPFTHVVRVTMMTLRRKLGDPPPIDTLRGVGYRLR